MTAYRLYTEEVRNGITDFDDEHFYILKNDYKKELSLVLNPKNFTPFIVARSVEYHELNSIDWAHGHYFETLDEAIKYMKGQ